MKKLLAVLLSLTLLLACGVPVFADDAPLGTLQVEKNGHTLDLSLLRLEIEGDKLVVSIQLDRLADWLEEAPPKLIVSFAGGSRKYTMDLYSAGSFQAAAGAIKSSKVTMSLPGEDGLPDRLLIDIGGDEALVLWAEEPGAPETDAGAEAHGIAPEYRWLDYTLVVDQVQLGVGKELEYPNPKAEHTVEPGAEIVNNLPDTVLAIRLRPAEGAILYADIRQETIEAFRLTDAAGEPIPLYSWGWWGFSFDFSKGGVETFDEQEGFYLYYVVPEDTAVETLTLTLGADKASRPGNTAAAAQPKEPGDLPAPDIQAAAPAETAPDLAEALLDALGGAVYRDTYEALKAGETLSTGSYGDAARGLQQTLADFGQGIGVDGSIGGMTIGTLNTVQAAFGLEETDSLDAEGYVALLTGLLEMKDADLAASVLTPYMDEAQVEYLRACALVLKGEYYGAKRAFEASGFADWQTRAAACVQPQPADGELWRLPGLYTDMVLTFNVNQESGRGMHIRIYRDGDELVSELFVRGTGSATASLPGGTYTIKDGVGEDWYGMADSFGDEGSYEIMTFDDGSTLVELQSGYAYTLTVNVESLDPDAENVGSRSTDRDNF